MNTIVINPDLYATPSVITFAEQSRIYDEKTVAAPEDNVVMLSNLIACPTFADHYRGKRIREWSNVVFEAHAYNGCIKRAIAKLADRIANYGTSHPLMIHITACYTWEQFKNLAKLPAIVPKDLVLAYIGFTTGAIPCKVDEDVVAKRILHGTAVCDIYARTVLAQHDFHDASIISKLVYSVYENDMLQFN